MFLSLVSCYNLSMTIDKIFSEALGLVLKPISGLGSYFLFVEQAIKRSFNPKIKWFLLLRQLEFVGNNSFGIVIISAAMIARRLELY